MPENRIHAFGPDLLAEHDAVALAELVRRREVKPIELAQASIARIQRVNGALNGLQTADYERALARADQPSTGAFAGVPTLLKDNTDRRGLPTGHGSRAVPKVPARDDGHFAKQYLAQGFISLGKTTLPEFGFSCTTEYQHDPPTRNPWNTDYSCGGSSGGSAALVAAGAVPIAQANDGGGSIRIPAACCGLVGLKPSRGRLVEGAMARTLPIKLIVEGVVTRSVRDTAYFFAGAEKYWCNPKLAPIGLVEGPSKRRLRIGLVMDSITGVPTCPQTRSVVEQTVALLESLGHRVDDMPVPCSESLIDDFSDYWSFLAFWIRQFGHRRFGERFDATRLDNLTLGLAARFRRRSWRLPLVLFRLWRRSQRHGRNGKGFDVVLSPVLGHDTPKLGQLSPEVPFRELFERMKGFVGFTPLSNIDGTPAISLPMGTTATGLPIGVQFSAAYGDERTLLALAYELEQAKPWQRITDNGLCKEPIRKPRRRMATPDRHEALG